MISLKKSTHSPFDNILQKTWPSCPAGQFSLNLCPHWGACCLYCWCSCLSWDQAAGTKAVQERHKKLCAGPPPALLMHLSCSCCPWFWPEPCWRCACAWSTSWPADLTSDFPRLLQSLVTVPDLPSSPCLGTVGLTFFYEDTVLPPCHYPSSCLPSLGSSLLLLLPEKMNP